MRPVASEASASVGRWTSTRPQALDSFVGKLVLVYPVDEPPEGEQPSFMEGLSVWGTFKRYPDATAPLRRSLSLSGFYARTGRHEVDLGDASLELYERQEAAYGFEGMGTSSRVSLASPSRATTSLSPYGLTLGAGFIGFGSKCGRSVLSSQRSSSLYLAAPTPDG
jgi:hypothetical protein